MVHGDPGWAGPRDTFDEFARWGQLVFFLDGLDEVPPGDVGVAAQAIADLRDRFSDCPMVVTSRPFKDALAWDSFRVLRIAPMSREQSLALIDRVAPDGDRKRDFTAFLSDAGEARVSGLLSNPLLAHLMFMTYDEWRADASPYVFYRHVLRTLFRDQDNRKPNFQPPPAPAFIWTSSKRRSRASPSSSRSRVRVRSPGPRWSAS